MSMFHELMMRKKEEIMYATIKGTLTENDGVFSGFSASNYLEVQGLYDCSKSFEVVLKIKTGVSNASGFLRMSNDGYGLFSALVGVTQNIGVWSRNTDNIYIANAVYGSDNSVPNNTDKFVKFVFTGTQYIIALSDDGIVWNTTNTINNSTNIGNRVTIKIGATSGTQYFNGSIDLNNSYIKLGSTKYKLQAVVGYTVVGSPTITDGVVSGFSASDYLVLSQQYSGAYPSGKIAFTYDRQSSMNQILLIMQRSTLFPFRIRAIDRNLQISWVDSDNTQQSMIMSYSLVVGVYYSATWEVKAGKIYFTLFDSLGNILETKNKDVSLEATTSGAGKIGWYSTTSYWQGSIDLNNTYIKDGNKLWFNGQQA